MHEIKIGHDEWVAQADARRTGHDSGWNRLVRWLEQVSPLTLTSVLVGVAALLPLLTQSDYVLRVAGTVCLLALLALGLTIVVGFTGLLDLSYVALYGLGAYAYAALASHHLGLHLPTWANVPLVVLLTALTGLVLGLLSLRLRDDYLAIVTLGFAQIFSLLLLNFNRVTLPWSGQRVNLTGGPNGITGIDPIQLFGWSITSMRDTFWLLLIVLGLVLLGVLHLQRSPVGRAWNALREDELAAAVMGMPVRRLKLLALTIGAAIAGLAGCLFAARQGAIFPANVDIGMLLLLYAVVVLGGLGSPPGVLVGASILVVVPELLRGPDTARLLFVLAVVALVLRMRPHWHALALLAGVVAGGIVLKAVVLLCWPGFVSAPTATTGLAALLQHWLVLPAHLPHLGNSLFVLVIGLLLLTSRVPQQAIRLLLLAPTLYLLALVWELRLVEEPGITRLLLLGALLVVLMMQRPQGFFGKPHREVF